MFDVRIIPYNFSLIVEIIDCILPPGRLYIYNVEVKNDNSTNFVYFLVDCGKEISPSTLIKLHDELYLCKLAYRIQVIDRRGKKAKEFDMAEHPFANMIEVERNSKKTIKNQKNI